MGKKTGIQQALDMFDGSPTRLAAAVGHDVSRQNVEHWAKVGRVAMDKCGVVRAATGIPLEALNDKVNWALVLGDAAPTKKIAAQGA